MNEENKGASKNKWSRIFRKKWFFPAVYLTIAALLLSAVVWYQNVDNQIPDAQKEQDNTEDYIPNLHDGEDAESVLEQQEVIKTPVSEADQDQAEIVTKFYDYNAEKSDQEDALVLYNNRYYQSTGVDIATANDDTFDVTASLSGTVKEVKEDPLLGNVVSITHENDVTTYYASLGEVDVKAGDELKQGDKIGLAGKNLFGKDVGTHVHFQLRKDDQVVNPESFFNQPVSKLDSTADEDVDAEENVDTEKDVDAEEEPKVDEEADDPSEVEDMPKEDEDQDGEQDEDEDAGNENPEQEQEDASNSSASA